MDMAKENLNNKGTLNSLVTKENKNQEQEVRYLKKQKRADTSVPYYSKSAMHIKI